MSEQTNISNHTYILPPDNYLHVEAGDIYKFIYCSYPISLPSFLHRIIPGGNVHKALKVIKRPVPGNTEPIKYMTFGFYPEGSKGMRGRGQISWPDPLCTRPVDNSKYASRKIWTMPKETSIDGIISAEQARLLNGYQNNPMKKMIGADISSTGNNYYTLLLTDAHYNIFGSFLNMFINDDQIILDAEQQTELDTHCAETWGANCRSFWETKGFINSYSFNNISRKRPKRSKRPKRPKRRRLQPRRSLPW